MLWQIVRSFSKKELYAFVAALVFLAASGTLILISLIDQNTVPVAEAGGEYRIGIVGQPAYLNPVFPYSNVDQALVNMTFANLNQLSNAITQVSANVWDVHLKQNIYWQDGEPITADDVVFTVNTIENPEANSPLFSSFNGVKAVKKSQLEIQFTTPTPYVFFGNEQLKNLEPIPEHIFSGVVPQNLSLSSYDLNPVGSGPYKATGYENDNTGFITQMTFEESDNYYVGQKPYIPKIVVKFYKTTQDAIRAFNLGQIDGLGLSTPYYLPQITLRHDVHLLTSNRYYAIFINQNASSSLINSNTRQALSEAVDRDALIQSLFAGRAAASYGPTNLVSAPNQSMSLGTSTLSGVNLAITVPNEDFLVKTAEMVKADWEKYGASVSIEKADETSFANNVLRGNSYSLLLFGNITKADQDLYSFWDSSQYPYPGQNLSLYHNSRVDVLLEDYRTNPDPNQRKNDLAGASQLIANDNPAIFLYSPDYAFVSSPNLGGLSDKSSINTLSDLFVNIPDWYVNTRRVLK